MDCIQAWANPSAKQISHGFANRNCEDTEQLQNFLFLYPIAENEQIDWTKREYLIK